MQKTAQTSGAETLDTSLHTRRVTDYLSAGEHILLTRQAFTPGTGTLPHTHDFYEFFRVTAGKARHRINGEEAVVIADDVVFVRRDDIHEFQVIGAEPFVIINFILRAELFNSIDIRHGAELSGRFYWSDAAHMAVAPLTRGQLARQEARERRVQQARRSALQVEAMLLDLFADLASDRTSASPNLPGWLSAAIDSLDGEAVLRDGAAGLVAASGRSHEHVCRVMREHLGLSPTEFVNRRRMAAAADMLAGTDIAISEIAYDCGLENLSHFYGLFRKAYGQTPAAFRRRHRMDVA